MWLANTARLYSRHLKKRVPRLMYFRISMYLMHGTNRQVGLKVGGIPPIKYLAPRLGWDFIIFDYLVVFLTIETVCPECKLISWN